MHLWFLMNIFVVRPATRLERETDAPPLLGTRRGCWFLNRSVCEPLGRLARGFLHRFDKSFDSVFSGLGGGLDSQGAQRFAGFRAD